MPILVFLGLSVLKLGPKYATDRRQTKASLNASALWGRRHNKTETVLQQETVTLVLGRQILVSVVFRLFYFRLAVNASLPADYFRTQKVLNQRHRRKLSPVECNNLLAEFKDRRSSTTAAAVVRVQQQK